MVDLVIFQSQDIFNAMPIVSQLTLCARVVDVYRSDVCVQQAVEYFYRKRVLLHEHVRPISGQRGRAPRPHTQQYDVNRNSKLTQDDVRARRELQAKMLRCLDSGQDGVAFKHARPVMNRGAKLLAHVTAQLQQQSEQCVSDDTHASAAQPDEPPAAADTDSSLSDRQKLRKARNTLWLTAHSKASASRVNEWLVDQSAPTAADDVTAAADESGGLNSDFRQPQHDDVKIGHQSSDAISRAQSNYQSGSNTIAYVPRSPARNASHGAQQVSASSLARNAVHDVQPQSPRGQQHVTPERESDQAAKRVKSPWLKTRQALKSSSKTSLAADSADILSTPAAPCKQYSPECVNPSGTPTHSLESSSSRQSQELEQPATAIDTAIMRHVKTNDKSEIVRCENAANESVCTATCGSPTREVEIIKLDKNSPSPVLLADDSLYYCAQLEQQDDDVIVEEEEDVTSCCNAESVASTDAENWT